jgi:hypothetical protein
MKNQEGVMKKNNIYNKTIFLPLIIIAVLLSSSVNLAQDINFLFKYDSNEDGPHNYFPTGVDISGKWAVAGDSYSAKDVNGNGNNVDDNSSGIVQIYENSSGGVFHHKNIQAPDRKPQSYFGSSVSIEGDILAVGAYLESFDAEGYDSLKDAGAVYVFYKNIGGENNWGFVQKITPPDRDSLDKFGFSVSLSGDYLFVGAPNQKNDDTGNNPFLDAGAVYIFAKDEGGSNNWGMVKKITPQDRNIEDRFGWSLDFDGNTAVVGAPYKDDHGTTTDNSGKIYLISQNNTSGEWEITKTISNPAPDKDEQFGRVVSVNDNRLCVSSPYEPYDENGENEMSNAGAVYLYNKNEGGSNNWGFTKKLTASDRGEDAYFGSDIDQYGDYVLIGSSGANVTIPFLNITYFGTGAAYLFSRNEGGNNNWGEANKISAYELENDTGFGEAVSISSTHAYIGNPFKTRISGNDTLQYGGALYVYGFNDALTSASKYNAIPNNYTLSQNYPNPFNPSTQISFSIPKLSNVNISIFNTLGQKVDEIINKNVAPGTHTVRWNAGEFSSGIYFYKLRVKSSDGSESVLRTKKMVLLK